MQGNRLKMSQSTRRKVLRFLGTIIVVLLPVLLAIWFAHIRAVSGNQKSVTFICAVGIR